MISNDIFFVWLTALCVRIFRSILLVLLSCFNCVRLCATPEMAAHQAPPSLGFSRQEHWSGLPFPSPTHESEKWKWSRSVMSDSERPHGLQPTRLFQARVLEWGVIAFSASWCLVCAKCYAQFWRYTWLGLCPIHGSVPGPSIIFDWGLVNHVWMNDITIWFCVEHLWFPPWCPISLFSVSFNSCLKDCVIWGQLTLPQGPKAKHVN